MCFTELWYYFAIMIMIIIHTEEAYV